MRGGGLRQAFRGDTKSYALLHGHSYTAHPIGCSVAIASLDAYLDPSLNPNLGATRGSLGRLPACAPRACARMQARRLTVPQTPQTPRAE